MYTYLKELPDKFRIEHLILISLALHMFVIPFPQDSVVFDEAYYTEAGRDLINGVGSNAEHPFLGKLWGVLGILTFGDNWFGWRFPFVIFGALTLMAFYKLANHFLDDRKALYASILLAFDNIFFIHSSLYLLEVPALFFSIATFYLYFRKRYSLAAVAMAIAILSKETSVFFLFALIIYHLAINSKHILRRTSMNMRHTTKQVVTFFVLVTTITAGPIWIYDITYTPPTYSELLIVESIQIDDYGSTIGTNTHTETRALDTINNPIEHAQYIVSYQSGLTIDPYDDNIYPFNYAWNWVLPLQPQEMVYYDLSIRKNVSNTENGKLISSTIIDTNPIHWAGIGNLPLWIIGFWVTLPLATYSIVKRRNTKLNLLILSWIAGNYVPYLAISLIVQRISYPFYFINTVPALALGFASLALINSTYRTPVKYFLGSIMISVLLWFFWFFPVRVTQF